MQDFGDSFDEDESSNDYGYDSDSDLEDDGETAIGTLRGVLKRVPPPEVIIKKALRALTLQKGTLDRMVRSGSLCRLGSGAFQKPLFEEYTEHPHKGKVVKIPDMAFIT